MSMGDFNMREFLKRNYVSLFVCVFAVLCIIAAHITSDNIYNPALEYGGEVLHPVKVEHLDEGTDVYTLHLEHVNAYSHTLLFYSNHQEITVEIEGEIIYSLKSAESVFGGTPGAMWNRVALPRAATVVVVTAVQAYPELANQKLVFELGNAINMYDEVMQGALYDLVLTVAIVLIGIALTAYWVLVFRRVNKQKDILYLGLFAIIFGIWNFGETQFAVFMFDNRAFWSYLAFTCLMVMCLPAVYFFREFMEVRDHHFHRIVAGYIVVETVACQILHLLGVAGVKETADYTVASIGLILIYLLFVIIVGIRKKRNVKKIVVNIIGLFILVATAVIDIGTYYTDVTSSVKVAKVGFLIYIIILGIETTRIAREKLQEEQKMEIIKEMAIKDLLTGCYNRNAYGEDIAAITDKTGIQMIEFDLNDLKKCNDTKGHKAGDKYIMDAAHVICEIFGDLGKVYRVGGDEFCIIAKGVSEESLLKKKEALKLAIKHYRLDHPDSGFGIACGYATYDAAIDADFEETRHRADISMYENKKEVKGN
ncbi:MAG: diguanylate cyclase [Lachnospiraceae bacterium]|nr:diguanylate cyclase [Lachnospiraceae bacterium]